VTKEHSVNRYNERFSPWKAYVVRNWYKKNQRFCADISSSCAVFNFKTCEIIEDTSSFYILQLQNG